VTRIGSLFSGYGGLDLGVQSAIGGQVVWHCEYDKAPSAILAHHYPGVVNFGDVKKVDWSTVEPIDVLTGGYPCQPFSHAGNRKGTNDERHLWPYFADAIGVLRPRLVILENVAGHVSLGLGDVLGDLAALGYDATWGVVRASDAGACHQRARVFIVAQPQRQRFNGSGKRESTQKPQIWRSDVEGSSGHDANSHNSRLSERDILNAANTDGTRSSRLHHREGKASAGGDGHSEPCSDDSAADANGRGWHEGVVESRDVSAQSGRGSTAISDGRSADGPAADASSERYGRREDAGVVGGVGAASKVGRRSTSAARKESGDRGAEDVADANIASGEARRDAGHHGSEFWAQSVGLAYDIEWGKYGPAIARWADTIGRPAPAPTESGSKGRPRLSPAFVEWMMGLPAGYVTDPAIGISRTAQLKMLGNGVVPLQATLALSVLLPLVVAA